MEAEKGMVATLCIVLQVHESFILGTLALGSVWRNSKQKQAKAQGAQKLSCILLRLFCFCFKKNQTSFYGY